MAPQQTTAAAFYSHQPYGLANSAPNTLENLRYVSLPVTPISTLPPSSSLQSSSADEIARQRAKELEEDQQDVLRELKCYEHEPVTFHAGEPPLYPASASFHPAKRRAHYIGTDSHQLSPWVMEALQIIKFSYRQDRLSFTDDLIAREEDYKLSGPLTRRAVEELISSGKLDELSDLMQNADDDDEEDLALA
ncbi:hypothetical protein DFJ58DRAFT_750456 [Suillus subalutaceus]|uniref:uncharacterized protein n=1 Tax=Suillus subalutaceus TaxID=48586 RepID=UPI001B87CFA1|nr:uncharacterized protein DFJ58DRAFT_750456 [Suillus subalutaceus]KAG1831663.1 hypothetical protein DFJ58DRAFT_750456 [Suillus subalutaceus]